MGGVKDKMNDNIDEKLPIPVSKAVEEEIKQIGEENVKKFQSVCNQSRVEGAEGAEGTEGAEGADRLEALKKEVFQEIPMISLGKIKATGTRAERRPQEEDKPNSGIVPECYPKIPIHKIENMDLYLTAYDNFLAQWIPDLEFHYTNPGSIEGGINQLANVIKLAFSDQYYTIRTAYLKIRKQIFTDLGLSRESIITEGGSVPGALVLLEKDEYRPEHFEAQVDKVFKNIQAKHLLDLNGHRGSGYFLIWHDKDKEKDMDTAMNKSGTLVALPTIGSFGHFLPEPGFSIIKEFGWPYLRHTEIIGFQIGHIRRVQVENPDGDWEPWHLRGPIYLEVTEQSNDVNGDYDSCAYDDTMIQRLKIDESFFPGIIFGQVQ